MAKILYVEDKESFRMILVKILQGMGHEVISFEFLADAQIAFNENKSQFDLVISDGNIQDVEDGFTWAQELYEEKVKILVVSLNVSQRPGMNIPFFDKNDFRQNVFEETVKKLLNS